MATSLLPWMYGIEVKRKNQEEEKKKKRKKKCALCAE